MKFAIRNITGPVIRTVTVCFTNTVEFKYKGGMGGDSGDAIFRQEF
jgi:hypothetical protein